MEPPSPVDAAADEPPAALLPAAAELLEPDPPQATSERAMQTASAVQTNFFIPLTSCFLFLRLAALLFSSVCGGPLRK